jgi:hypothetical protein
MRNRTPLDTYSAIPEEMLDYLSHHGKHFNKKMFEWAVSLMRKADGSKITPITKEVFDQKISANNINIQHDTLYDGMYVYCMALADFYGSSIVDEKHLLLFVKDYIDDPDAEDGFVFNRFYADCCLKGIPIDWDYML